MSVITKSLILFLLGVIIVPLQASAEELWPKSFDASIEPGYSGKVEIILMNDLHEDAEFDIDLLQVESGETHEDLTFSPLPEEMASWIHLDHDALLLAANSQGTIGLTLNPDASIEPKTYVLGVQVTRLNTQEAPSLLVQTSIVSLGFISVGNVSESVTWIGADAQTDQWGLPVVSSVTVRNEGERVVIPQGTMRIMNLFGRERARIALNETGLRVLEGQTRTFTTQWGTSQDQEIPRLFGIYFVEFELQPWSDGDTFHARQRIVVFPWRGLLVLLAVLLFTGWLHRFSRGST